MKNSHYFLILTLVFSLNLLNAQITPEIKLPEVAQKITYLSDKYEGFRTQKNELIRQYGWGSNEVKANETILNDQLEVNYAAAVRIMKVHGFPATNLVGEEASHKFWMMVQHLDAYPQFQMQVLRRMNAAVENGTASHKDFAYLTDRVLIGKGQPQHYGTQVYYDETTMTYKVHPIDDVKGANQRRSVLGLPPLDDFVAATNNKYEGAIEKPEVKSTAESRSFGPDYQGMTRSTGN